MNISLAEPNVGEAEKRRVAEVLDSGQLKGGGDYDERCATLLEDGFDAHYACMTPSCTHALEMAALLLDIAPGDEVIVPSFTFPSTANAFTLRGAELSFCEIERSTLNIDVDALAGIVTDKTKVIVPVHYGGVGCDMERINELANSYNAHVVEDAAQAVNAKYQGSFLGTEGDIGCYSFHGTKSYSAGEGGALILNDERFVERAEYLRYKGTNYEKFRRGEVDRYTWVDVGSSYVPSEMQTALAYEQLLRRDEIKNERLENFRYYRERLSGKLSESVFRLQTIPGDREPNAQLFALLTEDADQREALLSHLHGRDIGAASHFEPLHASKMGGKFGYVRGDLPVTEEVAASLVRLPVHEGLGEEELEYVIDAVDDFF